MTDSSETPPREIWRWGCKSDRQDGPLEPSRSGKSVMKYKVLRTDNYDRETIAHRVVAENLGHYEADAICERLRRERLNDDDWWTVVPQDAHVWRGMEEFV